MASCYDSESQNGLRICAIIVEEGTEVVKRLFESFIKDNKHKDVSTCLEYFRGKAKTLLNNGYMLQWQYDKIYPNDKAVNSIKKFDLNIFIFIFAELLELEPRFYTCKLSDDSQSAHLKRLRHLRNEMFAHINTIKSSIDNLKRLKDSKKLNYNDLSIIAKVEKSIYGLCKQSELQDYQNRITKRLEDNLDGDMMHNYRDKISNSVLEDHRSTTSVIEAFMKKLSNNGEKKHVELVDKIRKFQESYNKRENNCLNMLNKIIKDLNNLNPEYMNNIKDEIIDKINETEAAITSRIDSLREKVESSTNTLSNKMETVINNVSNTSNNIQSIESNITNINSQSETVTRQLDTINNTVRNIQSVIQDSTNENCTLEGLKHYFSEEKDLFFKILILSADNLHKNTDRKQIIDTVAAIDWSIIIDLDHSARVRDKGIAEGIKTILEDRRNTIVSIYDKLEEFDKANLKLVQDEKWTAYILANGCEDFNVPKPKKFQPSIRKIGKFMESVYAGVRHKKILITTFFLNQMYDEKDIQDIFSLQIECYNVLDCLNENEDNLPFVTINFLPLDLINSNSINTIDRIMRDASNNYESKINKASFAQVASTFDSLRPKEIADCIRLPGKQGTVLLERKEWISYESVVEIYSETIGRVELPEDETERINKLKDLREPFLKGCEITPTQLFIHSPPIMLTYADRELTKLIMDRVNDLINNKEIWFKEGETFYYVLEINHDSCAGATTVGRTILYQMRETMPCIRIKRLMHKESLLYPFLKKVYEQSQLPLLILIDSSDFHDELINREYVTEINRDLSRKHSVKSIVILIRRTSYFLLNTRNSKDPKNPIYELQSNLSPNETVAFKNLYKNYLDKETIKSLPKNKESGIVYWFGLMAFGEEYESADKIAEHLIERCKENEPILNLLFLISFYYIYAAQPFPLDLAAVYLNMLPDRLYERMKDKRKVKMEGAFESLYKTLLVKDETSNIRLRPIHKVIAENLIKAIPTDFIKTSPIELFFKEYTALVKMAIDKYPDELTETTAHLFILYKREGSEIFTYILEETERIHEPNWTAQKLSQLNDIFSQKRIPLTPSFGVLYARFLFYRVGDTNEGIKMMKKALGINFGQLSGLLLNSDKAFDRYCDTTHFSVYGNFNKKLLFDNYEKAIQLNLDNFNPRNYYIENLKPYAVEAVLAYRKAQLLPKTDILKSQYLVESENFKHNVKAYAGECRVRLKTLHYYFEFFYNKNKEKYTDALFDSNTDDFIRECDIEINAKLDELEMLQENNQAQSSTKSDIDYFDTMKAKLQLLDSKVDYKFQPTIQTIFKRQKPSIPFHVYDIVRLLMSRKKADDYEKVTWEEISNDKLILDSIIEKCKTQLDNGSRLFSNYRDLLTAYIYAQKHKEYTSRTYFEQAILWARKWQQQFTKEGDTLFYLGLLYFIDGYDKNDRKRFSDAITLLNDCRDIYKKITHPPSKFKRPEFFFGKNSGLQRLVPYKEKPNLNLLERFRGRFHKNGKYIEIKHCDETIKAQYVENVEFTINTVEQGREKEYEFYLIISRSSMMIWRPTLIKENQ